jgi:hypothetical protein
MKEPTSIDLGCGRIMKTSPRTETVVVQADDLLGLLDEVTATPEAATLTPRTTS